MQPVSGADRVECLACIATVMYMLIFERTKLLIGTAGLLKLADAHVAVFGVGGVGSNAAEALVRAGIGTLTLVDFDRIVPSNVNRQLHATTATVGGLKVDVMAKRCRDINPDAIVHPVPRRFDLQSAPELLAPGYAFVIDAIDTLSFKVQLLDMCIGQAIPVVSSMGAASRLCAESVRIGDLFSTRDCPLARLVRKRLRRRGISGSIPAVYSSERPLIPPADADLPEADRKRASSPNGTISYMPALFGLHCAGYVIEQLLRDLPLERRGQTPRLGPRHRSCQGFAGP